MFKVSFMVEDRKLAGVMRAVASNGPVFEMDAVPVDNALPKPVAGKVVAKNANGKTAITEMVLPKKGTVIQSKDFKPLLVSIGWSPASYTYGIGMLMKASMVKRIGVGQYEVL